MLTFDHIPKKALPPLIKINYVEQVLSVSRHTVRNLISSGDLEAAPLNSASRKRKHVLVTSASLQTLYKKRFGHSLLRAIAHAREA